MDFARLARWLVTLMLQISCQNMSDVVGICGTVCPCSMKSASHAGCPRLLHMNSDGNAFTLPI
jgi:hypothetical protein